jgi:hypothetical protein
VLESSGLALLPAGGFKLAVWHLIGGAWRLMTRAWMWGWRKDWPLLSRWWACGDDCLKRGFIFNISLSFFCYTAGK